VFGNKKIERHSSSKGPPGPLIVVVVICCPPSALMSGNEDGSRYRKPTAEERASATRLVAQWDYQPTLADDSDIPLTAGEVVHGVELNGEWWWGFNRSRSGIFPANFVKEEEAEDAASGAAAQHDSRPDVYEEDEQQEAQEGEEEAQPLPPPRASPRRIVVSGGGGGGGGEGGGSSGWAAESERSVDGPDPFADEEDDESLEIPAGVGSVGNNEASADGSRLSTGGPPTMKSSILKNLPGINVQWLLDDTLLCGHEVQLWNGRFSGFVPTKLLLSNNFLTEVVYFTPDLPEITV
jgi:hypothetical protein